MEFSPIAVYGKAVAAVPSLKYALGVAGVVAAATIAYNLSHEDPRRAILAFIFVLAGMYLLLIFASAGKVGPIIRGPVITVVWALTILFVASLVLTLLAYAAGAPCGWATLVGAACAELRTPSAEGSKTAVQAESSVATLPMQRSEPVAPSSAAASDLTAASTSPAASAQPIPVQETFKITDSSNDCGVNQTRTLEYCLGSGAKVLNWAGPHIESANCGSTIANVRRVAERANCIAVDVSVRGCGYDNILGIKNCKGRGWVGGTIVISGERAP